MGYEAKMLVGEVSAPFSGDEARGSWFRVIAMLELCKVGSDLHLAGAVSNRPVFFYGIDGNTEVTEDDYGKRLTALEVQEVLRDLQNANAKEPYRRFQMAIELLESITDKFPTDRLGVVLYGH